MVAVPTIVANAEAGSCRDHHRWGWGIVAINAGLGAVVTANVELGGVTTVNARAGHCCHGHQRWSFQEKNKERNLDLPTRSTRSCTDEADGFNSCPSTLNVRIHVRGGGDSSRGCEKVSASADLLPEVQYHIWGSQKGPETKQTRRTCTRVHGALRKTRKGLQIHQNVLEDPKSTWKPILTWYKRSTAPRGATKAREPRGCIGTHAQAE